MVYVCVWMHAAIFESLLLLKAFTDPHQICCEGQITNCRDVYGWRSFPVGGSLHCETGKDG